MAFYCFGDIVLWTHWLAFPPETLFWHRICHFRLCSVATHGHKLRLSKQCSFLTSITLRIIAIISFGHLSILSVITKRYLASITICSRFVIRMDLIKRAVFKQSKRPNQIRDKQNESKKNTNNINIWQFGRSRFVWPADWAELKSKFRKNGSKLSAARNDWNKKRNGDRRLRALERVRHLDLEWSFSWLT